ncbi:hypothetical protein HDV05_000585 [Chytridiales sp. JEL 0842]|nr:hypothetical protein HDV05_000585 [Chytridiales sp. JEL 0842]
MTIVETATNVAQGVAARVDPYVPKLAKDAANFGIKTATSAVNTGISTATYVKDTAVSTATGIKDRAVSTATGAYNYTASTATWAVNGATTTVTAYTPGPVRDLIHNTLTGANALRQDPVGTVKPYVPTFIIHTGEKTYEIVADTTQKTKDAVSATSGYIVTKVNGTVTYVTSIPQIHAVIEKLNGLASPVINRVYGTKKDANGKEVPVTAEEAAAETKAATEE